MAISFKEAHFLPDIIPTVSPLMIPLIYCHTIVSNDHPAWRSHGQKAKRGQTGGQRIPWHGEVMGSFFSRARHRGVLARERVPERCHASGAAVDVCRAAPAWAQRAERAANGGVVDVSRARSVSPRAPCIIAQRVARFDHYNIRNCLPPKKLRREIQ